MCKVATRNVFIRVTKNLQVVVLFDQFSEFGDGPCVIKFFLRVFRRDIVANGVEVNAVFGLFI